jgi:hypothetical protein
MIGMTGNMIDYLCHSLFSVLPVNCSKGVLFPESLFT